MAHAADANELLEVLGDELRAIVANEARPTPGKCLSRSLQDDLDIRFLHAPPQLPVDDVPATTVQHADQVIECAADVDVADVDMPMLVGC
jgi:hypothetical protein